MTSHLKKKLEDVSKLVSKKIEQKFQQNPNELTDAMLHSLLPVGKCLRPFLLISAFEIFSSKNSEFALEVAAAVEMVHVFSLVHDDLPALDDDDFRRNRLSCHKKFGEAMAILAGDALLTKAFETIVSSENCSNHEIKTKIVTLLCEKICENGMIMGQVLDLNSLKSQNKLNHILEIIHKKTCALFEFSSAAGAIIANASQQEIEQLQDFAHNFGLAFQIIDDLEDLEEDEKNSDKLTIAMFLGADEAKKMAEMSLQKATESLENFGEKAENLELLIEYFKLKIQHL